MILPLAGGSISPGTGAFFSLGIDAGALHYNRQSILVECVVTAFAKYDQMDETLTPKTVLPG